MSTSRVGSVGVIKEVITAKGHQQFRFPWYEWRLVVEGGVETRQKEQHTGTGQTMQEADALRSRIIGAHLRGERYKAEQDRPVGLLREAGLAYVQAARDDKKPEATVRWRLSALNRLIAFMGDRALLSDLSPTKLRGYHAALDKEGLRSAHRYLAAAEGFWRWAVRRKLPGVPDAETVSDEITPPAPVVALDTPRWADVDAMITNLDRREWHRRVALVLRYTGIRASQCLSLERSDVNLDRGILLLRARARGAKGATRNRAVPMHPDLTRRMKSWDLAPTGLIFASEDDRRQGGKTGRTVWREDALWEPFTRAWKRAKVPESRWGAPAEVAGGRDHARPVHAIRACVATELRWSRCAEVIVDLLVGHSTAATKGAYVPESSPEVSPYWGQMVEAVATIPPYREPEGRVVAFGT